MVIGCWSYHLHAPAVPRQNDEQFVYHSHEPEKDKAMSQKQSHDQKMNET
jgi:hypothetical protein